jgi:uncharacterized Fe-S cluster protein YjdI
MKDITKHYSNGEVTIVWKPAMCIHSTVCWKGAAGLPGVFHPQTRPWITPDEASTEQIIDQVKKCPSGALSYFMNELKGEPELTASEVIAEVMQDGPLLVYGNLNVKAPDGTESKHSKMTAFCRCGASGNKPFCDGSHVKIGFKG